MQHQHQMVPQQQQQQYQPGAAQMQYSSQGQPPQQHHQHHQQQPQSQSHSQGYPGGAQGGHSHGGQHGAGGQMSSRKSGTSGHRQRSSTMHQHRSSAAAISDPMMGAGITEQLASASGPLTGSGSALNQLGLSGYPAQAGYYGGMGARGAPPMMMAADQLGYQDYPMQAQQLHGQPMQAGALGRPHAQYDPQFMGAAQRPSRLDYIGTHGGASYALDPMSGAGYPQGYPTDRGYPMEGRAASMPPPGAQLGYQTAPLLDPATGAPLMTGGGLGPYNPLDDPLGLTNPPTTMRSHQQQQSMDPSSMLGAPMGGGYPPAALVPPLPPSGVAPGQQQQYIQELRQRFLDLQNSYVMVKRELDVATQKVGSSMHSIKSFWSPELKKERALRKEEATRYALINDQMKNMRLDFQKQANLIRHLEEQLRSALENRLRATEPDIQQHIDALCNEKDALFKDNCHLRDVIRELEMRIETQKQTLTSRDESIKRMIEMMNNKGIATKLMEDERLEMDRIKTRNIELEARVRHYETILETKEKDIIKTSSSKPAASKVERLKNRLRIAKTTITQQDILNSNSNPNNKDSSLSSSTSSTSGFSSSASNSMDRMLSRLGKPQTADTISKDKSSSSRFQQHQHQEQYQQQQDLATRAEAAEFKAANLKFISELERHSRLAKQKQLSIIEPSAAVASLTNNGKSTTKMAATSQSAVASQPQPRSREASQQQQAQAAQLRNSNGNINTNTNINTKPCDCLGCRQSMANARPPTPPRATTRKAVSFRASVEHIGARESPGLDLEPPNETQTSMVDSSSLIANASELMNDSQASMSMSNSMLRNCSTPKAGPHQNLQLNLNQQRPAGFLQAEIHEPPAQLEPSNQLVAVKTHHNPPRVEHPDYTCMCSPDFLCHHNFPQQHNILALPPTRPLNGQSTGVVEPLVDYPLVPDCADCENVSTYVNLSIVQPQPQSQPQPPPRHPQQEQYQPLNNNSQPAQQPLYSGQPPRLLQEPFYGNLDRSSLARQLVEQTIADCKLCNPLERPQQPLLAQQPALAALSRSQQQLYLNSSMSNELPCSCHPREEVKNGNNTSNTRLSLEGSSSRQQPQNSTLSYHSASQSMETSMLRLQANQSLNQTANQHLYSQQQQANRHNNSSQLSVLPLNLNVASSSNRLNSIESDYKTLPAHNSVMSLMTQQQADQTNNNVDSSLSSLFAYKHVSDEFEPDSLEIDAVDKPKAVYAGQPRSNKGPDYTYLSSTTSSGTMASNANNNRQHKVPATTQSNPRLIKTAARPTVQVDTDVSQSSLAKRRQLSHSLQQQQQLHQPHQHHQQQAQQSSSSSKSKKGHNHQQLKASKSTPNLSSAVSGKSTPRNQQNSSSNSNSNSNSNVKNIYLSLKNHLLDMRMKKETPATSTSTSQLHQQLKGASNSLPRQVSVQEASSKNNNQQTKVQPKGGRKSVQMDELRTELKKSDQELMTATAKLRALEEQHRDSQRHIRVLKESLMAKEEQCNLLLADADELRRNLDERNRLLERKSYQQRFASAGPNSAHVCHPGANQAANNYELDDMQTLIEMRDKRINELQRKCMQLDNLLVERDAQLERARVTGSSARGLLGATSGPSGGPLGDSSLVGRLEDTIGDKDRQLSLYRDQRDRAERELAEERDSHERSIKEYQMRLHTTRLELEKLQCRLGAKGAGLNLMDNSMDSTSGSSLKRLELDKRALQVECDQLRHKIETLQLTGAGSGARGVGASGRRQLGTPDVSVVELETLQETIEAQRQELRRAQAEARMNDMERKRVQDEKDQLLERLESLRTELTKCKARMENAISEREQVLQDYDRQQQMVLKIQQERDIAASEANQVKAECESVKQSASRSQLQVEKLAAQLERSQLEMRKFEDRTMENSDQVRSLMADKSSLQREVQSLQMALESQQLEAAKRDQERDCLRLEAEKLRDKYARLEAELDRMSRDHELGREQSQMYKDRLAELQQVQTKWLKERDELAKEIHELRDRLHKVQSHRNDCDLELKNELRISKDKCERLLVQYDKINEELANKSKELAMVMEKLQRLHADNVKLESKLEQSEMDRERLVIEIEKLQQHIGKTKDEHKRWQDESEHMKELYAKTSNKLIKLTAIEEKLRIDYDKCQMDLEVLRERYDKLQLESRKLQNERDRIQMEFERLAYEHGHGQMGQATSISGSAGQQGHLDGAQLELEVQRQAQELAKSAAKLEQYQREINKVQIEKERLRLETKAQLQQGESQYQQQILKLRSSEERLATELERQRMQLDKAQSKCDQVSAENECLAADRDRLQAQVAAIQQELDKLRGQQTSSSQQLKQVHEDQVQRLAQELETVKDKYTQQRKELLQLRELQQNHDTDRDILKRQLENAEQRLEKMVQADAKQKQDAERNQLEFEKLRDRIERKQEELARCQKERNQFAQEVNALHQQLQQVQQQLASHQEAASGAQNQPQQAQAQSNQAQQGAQSQAQQQASQQEVAKLKQMLVKSEQELQKYRAENQRLQLELERLKSQLDEAAEYMQKAEAEQKAIEKQSADTIVQLKQHLAAAQAQAQAQNQGQNQNQNQAQNQAQAQELGKMQELIKKTSAELQRVGDEKSKLLEINRELQSTLEQTKQEFSHTVDQYEQELQRLENEAQNQPEANSKAQAASGQQEEQLKAKLKEAVEAIRQLQSQSDELKRDNKQFAEQNQALVAKLKASEEQLAVVVKQLQETSKNKPAAGPQEQQQVEQMRKQVGQLGEVRAKLEQELAKSLHEAQQREQSNQKLKQELDKSQAEITSVKTERDRMQSQLEKLMVELERRQGDVAQVQGNQDKALEALRHKEQELAQFQRQLEERDKALEAKRAELDKAQKASSQQQQQPSSQQVEMIAKLHAQLKHMEDERNKLAKEVERLNGELKRTQQELERLLNILTTTQQEKAQLEQQLDQLHAKLKSMPQQQQPASQQAQQRPPPGAPAGAQQRPQQAPPQKAPQQPPPRQQPQQQQQQSPQQQPPQQQQQQQKPAQSQKCDLSNFTNFTIQDSLELLEIALKKSLEWSMKRHQLSMRLQMHEPKSELHSTLRAAKKTTSLNDKLRNESYVRGFVSHFKVVLNSLIEKKLSSDQDNSSSSSPNDDSEHDSDDDEDTRTNSADMGLADTDCEEQYIFAEVCRTQYNGYRASSIPTIIINGKHCGQYDIAGAQAEKQCPDLDTDDGYRSLSRSESSLAFRSAIVLQLNEIKLRLIDLAHELEFEMANINTKGQREPANGLAGYKRRTDSLVTMIESVVESFGSQMVPKLTTNSNSKPINSNSNSNLNGSAQRVAPRGYEHQEQVINYSESGSDLDQDMTITTTRAMSALITDHNKQPRPLPSALMHRNAPIDYGAMMREFEAKRANKNGLVSSSSMSMSMSSHQRLKQRQKQKQIQAVETDTNGQNQHGHVTSSSSASTYSVDSHASSTSSFL